MGLLELRNVKKIYRTPEGELQTVLDLESFHLDAGEQVGLAGTSGSGKTTFLNVVAGILRADEGEVIFDGEDLALMSEGGRDLVRAQSMGYVFQTFNLLDGYSALENVILGMVFGPGADREYAQTLLEELGLGHRLHHRPSQMSIGQQQRVAVARALANRPKLVLADEPTGNLDPTHAAEALALLRDGCRKQGAALLLVSHDQDVLSGFERVESFTEINRAGRAAGGAS
ncbi:MAG: ABC transporter ATP-binding protein [Planctomycetota bacterium]|nr:ABC transporter ATP-binding protein [Planctomycetota bacterium]